VLFRTDGNIGDTLIHAGTRALLRDIQVTEYPMRAAPYCEGPLAIVSGGGGWCRAYHDMPMYLREIEQHFDRVVVLPSSFEVASPVVVGWLQSTRAEIFVRELESQRQVSGVREVDLALDTAFFFDYRAYMQDGRGVLKAYRTDAEKKVTGLPDKNLDISRVCADLEHWLRTIGRHEVIATDRMHVMIAAAMLEKRIVVSENCYHKVRSMADYALGSYDRIEWSAGHI